MPWEKLCIVENVSSAYKKKESTLKTITDTYVDHIKS